MFVLVVGAHALMTGVLDIAFAIRLRKLIHGEWLLILSGVASIVFGAMVFLFPGAGALAMIWLISLYAVLTGALLLGLSFRLRARSIAGAAARTERRIMPDRPHADRASLNGNSCSPRFPALRYISLAVTRGNEIAAPVSQRFDDMWSKTPGLDRSGREATAEPIRRFAILIRNRP